MVPAEGLEAVEEEACDECGAQLVFAACDVPAHQVHGFAVLAVGELVA